MSSRLAAISVRISTLAIRRQRTKTEDSVFSMLPVEWVSALAKTALLSFRFLGPKGTTPMKGPTWNSWYLERCHFPLSMSHNGRKGFLETFWRLLPCSSNSLVLSLPFKCTLCYILQDTYGDSYGHVSPTPMGWYSRAVPPCYVL